MGAQIKPLCPINRRYDMTIAYPVIFTQTKDEKGTYLVYIPDMDGATEGYGIADAIHMARDYIGSLLYNKDPETIPRPSD